MHILIVYSHPNPESFTHALMDSYIEGLNTAGHSHEVVDLYEIQFNPNLKIEDYNTFVGGPPPEDVIIQQEKVAKADMIAFFCQVLWSNLPPNVLGWIIRVFSYNFAYQLTDDGWKGSMKGRLGLLKQQKALIISPTFFSEKDYEETGIKTAMEKLIAEYGFVYPGIKEAEYVLMYQATSVNDKTQKKYLERAKAIGLTQK